MACGCRTITKVCLCRHKERIRHRCIWSQLREGRSCWAAFTPSCHAERKRYRVERVCVECRDYFYQRYGKENYKRFAKLFLAYKESRGWQKSVVDPRSVPHEVLTHSEKYGTTRVEGQQPSPPHQSIGMSLLQPMPDYAKKLDQRPSPAPSPSPARSRSGDVDDWRRKALPPIPEQESTEGHEDRGKAKDGNAVLQPYRYEAGKNNKPLPDLPTDPSFFAVGEEEEEEDEETLFTSSPSPILSGFPRVPTPKSNYKFKSKSEEKKPMVYEDPQPNYAREMPAPGQIVPELAHLAQFSQQPLPVGTPELQHPCPVATKLRHKLKKVSSNGSIASEASLVTRLRLRAESMERRRQFVPGEDGIPVPVLDEAPKSRRRSWLAGNEQPAENSHSDEDKRGEDEGKCEGEGRMRKIDIALAAGAVPDSLIPGGAKGKAKGKGRATVDRRSRDAHDSDDDVDVPSSAASTTSRYVVHARADNTSPTGVSARVRNSPTHETVVIPPPRRLDGVVIPSASACPKHSNTNTNTSNGEGEKGGKSPDCPECRGMFFRERGVASEHHVEECRSATFPSSVYVSVSTPRRRYSCAVQSCYCERSRNRDAVVVDKCPSCQERDSIAAEFQTTWI